MFSEFAQVTMLLWDGKIIVARVYEMTAGCQVLHWALHICGF